MILDLAEVEKNSRIVTEKVLCNPRPIVSYAL